MQPRTNRAAEKAAVTIWTAIAVVTIGILVLIIGFGTFFYMRHQERISLKNAALEQEARKARQELERKNAEDQGRITLAQTQRDQVLSPIRSATNLLGRLLVGIEKVGAEAQALRTSDAGKAIARHEDLTRLAKRVFDTELKALPSQDEVTTKLEGARRIEQQLVASAGTTYMPDAEMEKRAQDLISWSTEGEVKLSRVRQSLDALIQESKAKVSTGNVSAGSSTLEAAMNSLAQKEAASGLKIQDAAATEARAAAEIEEAKAEAKRIKTEAEIKANAMLADAQAKKEQAELDLKEREAQMKVQVAKTQVAVEKHEDEAMKVVLRQRASDPQVLAELAPFTTPGYWKLRGFDTEKKPLSYTAIQNAGALSDDLRGYRALLDIATSSYDKVRPRWKMNRNFFMTRPEQLEKVKNTQKLLVELGPVLVEKGLLEP